MGMGEDRGLFQNGTRILNLKNVWQLKDLQACFLDVWQAKELQARFSQVWQGKELREFVVRASGCEDAGKLTEAAC